MCSPGAFTMGWRAGEMAALAAKKQSAFLSAGQEKLESLKEFCSDTTGSKEGLYWREVEMAIQNIMDYYACDVRSEPMLSRGLERLNEIRRNVSFRAENPHELMRCLEVRVRFGQQRDDTGRLPGKEREPHRNPRPRFHTGRISRAGRQELACLPCLKAQRERVRVLEDPDQEVKDQNR